MDLLGVPGLQLDGHGKCSLKAKPLGLHKVIASWREVICPAIATVRRGILTGHGDAYM